MLSKYPVKCVLEKEEQEEVRRFALASPSFNDLETIVLNAHGSPLVSLRYHDGEDWCLIESDQELSEAFKVADGSTLKIKAAAVKEVVQQDCKVTVTEQVQPDLNDDGVSGSFSPDIAELVDSEPKSGSNPLSLEEAQKVSAPVPRVNVPKVAEGQQHNIPCKICGKAIVGDRYKCVVCFNLDMCSSCQASHSSDHPLILAKSAMYLPARPPVSWFFKRAEVSPVPPLIPSRSGNNRIPCRYWAACYRKNPVHLARFLHPDDEEEEEVGVAVGQRRERLDLEEPVVPAGVDGAVVDHKQVNAVDAVEQPEEAGPVSTFVDAMDQFYSPAVLDSGIKVNDEREDFWVCKSCTYHNSEDTQDCEVCGTTRAWTCGLCTYVNVQGSVRRCGVCRSARPF